MGAQLRFARANRAARVRTLRVRWWKYSRLVQKRKLSPDTVAHHLWVLRFFFIKTLNKAWSIAETPYPNRTHRLPTILSQKDVAQLIDAARTPFHHTGLMTLYTAAEFGTPS
jgi:site-specific recombinase XerD